ncbi:MAG: family 88 glycosyl hydrolase [Actinobacteria bacterium 13_2_20CM_2_71_6]|nr:MAG: family 88 glycosyl hydrolase [Actinobacteria bacterium 13_2_20CM_2_71_6]
MGRRILGRLIVVVLAASVAVAVAPPVAQAARPATATDPSADPRFAHTDWSKALVESTMQRFTPQTLGGWGYTQGLYLYGQYLVFKRTGDPRYLDYIKAWVDRFVRPDGTISNSFNNLDSMRSGVLLLILYRETGDQRYRIAADKIRHRLDTYPRTSDGGFWHATSRQWQLWADGTFMVLPFLAEYGAQFGDRAYTDDEVTKQLLIYASHLQAGNGLLLHAFDEKRVQPWADPVTGLSPEHWCRAIGWYGMATVDVLEIIPRDHPRRQQLISILRNLVGAFARYQDLRTGRWFQVVDKGQDPANWTETSCSSMYTFVTARAVLRGYVSPLFAFTALNGYRGVLDRISLGPDGLTNLAEICIGTNVGNLAFYFARPRAVNDLHGLGSFLIMNEQLRYLNIYHPAGA